MAALKTKLCTILVYITYRLQKPWIFKYVNMRITFKGQGNILARSQDMSKCVSHYTFLRDYDCYSVMVTLCRLA